MAFCSPRSSRLVSGSWRLSRIARRSTSRAPPIDGTLLWNFTVLGEAAGQLSDEIKHDHPEVGWASPVRMRNRIVHGYWSIDLDILVTTARDDLGRFLEAVRAILDAEPGAADPS